ncbi:MAG: excinuclease ABC subunit A [Gemmataceae bacterium]
MESKHLIIRGAREHNLRNVNLDLPRNKLIVFTGVSGSGKSSLAFDTLYAEGQRRYIESLSSFARQFVGQMQKPDVDYLGGLSPAISIQQKTGAHNPRSTVGTITEIYDFLRVLYARVGKGYCPRCDKPIAAQSRDQIIEQILTAYAGRLCLILAPVVRGQKGEYKDLFEEMLRKGFVRARVDGQIVHLGEDIRLDKQIKHHIEIVIDRLRPEQRTRARLAEAVEQALAVADGTLLIACEPETSSRADGSHESGHERVFSARYACPHCGSSYDPPSPQLFSFNSPQGMCPACDGLGVRFDFDPDLLVPDPSRSFAEGAVEILGPLKDMGRWRRHIYEGVAASLGIDLHRPWRDLPAEHRRWLLYGSGERHITYTWRHRGGIWKHGGTWEGIVPQLIHQYRKAAAGPWRAMLEKYLRRVRCSACQGQRLNPVARAVRVAGLTLVEVCAMPIGELAQWVASGGPLENQLTGVERLIAGPLLKEIRTRLQFLTEVGLDYLTLDRPAPSLSGGEAQRIRLASQIGSALVGVLYILDEPSIGLHPRDNARLLASLKRLRDLGNTVIVVEHDEETMRAADHIVDFGPGPGVHGGAVVAQGSVADLMASPRSVTGKYLSGERVIPVPERRRPRGPACVRIFGAAHNNLKNIDVEIPLGLFVCVTGVSGSGKSSLVHDILYRALRRKKHLREEDEPESQDTERPGRHRRITGAHHIDRVIEIDQSPIGRTPRSNPATYVKVFDEIRELFARLPQARVRGYKPGRFSFNVPGGRCDACEGNGARRLEMDFLADVWLTCDLCEGKRFNRETLQIHYRDKNIHDVLEMTVEQTLDLFAQQPRIVRMLQTLKDVGLDYIKLGQPSPTLSGGEAQRIKLARELCRPQTGHTLYILDEPTTGLHFEDIAKLLKILHGFVDRGHTVLVIEHNLEVIKTADWIIDLGPEGGAAGGYVVCAGTPEQVAACDRSYTGQALRAVLDPARKKRPPTVLPRRVRRTAPRNGTSSMVTHITVQGARQHNLKNLTVSLPREALTVCCGPSGSGKTSFAVDTLYAEGQRRYVESLSAYARQFLMQMEKPSVEQVTGLSPAICIEQKSASKSPRSTVGTITEIHDYLRILFARLGQPYCPRCQVPAGSQAVDEIIDRILAYPEGARLYILAPVERRGQEKYQLLWDEMRRAGFTRVRVDGVTRSLDDAPAIDHRRHHTIEVVLDRVVVRKDQRGRIAEAVESALELGKGVMRVALVQEEVPETQWPVETFSHLLACRQCGRSLESLGPNHFSFNSPLGWCPVCEGLGVQMGANPDLLVRSPALSLRAGAMALWPGSDNTAFVSVVEALARRFHLSLDIPWAQLDAGQRRTVLHGTGDAWTDVTQSDPQSGQSRVLFRFQYKGIFPAIDEAARVSPYYRQVLDAWVTEIPCTACGGSRLREDAAAVRFRGKTLAELARMPLGELSRWFEQLQLSTTERKVAGEVIREITARLRFLLDVGLDYLTLDRPGPTLSGGEAQRIRLASQIGSGLTGVLYVLDEPTIGLHPRDNHRLIAALHHLRDLGNTLVVVEHDREVISHADYLLDFGPGAGRDGGAIVAQGPPRKLMRIGSSLTGKYLSGRTAIPVPTRRRIVYTAQDQPVPPSGAWLAVRGARHNNLKHIDVLFPLGCLIAVTGVSGSGKSSLVNDVLYSHLARHLHRARVPLAACEAVTGLEHIDKVIQVDQSPIGSTPASNPATYTGVFDHIRMLFAQLPEARMRGYTPRRFSFNKPGGRCEACEGNGRKRIEMHFLPDIWVECDVCHGTRYQAETLHVRYHGHSIADVLAMSVSQAAKLFEAIPPIRRILQTLQDVGLGYLALGQPAPTLSGGEAQRVKLAAELARPNTGRTLYLLDEPTTGLHFDDILKLLHVLHRLVQRGNTVIVIEHNLDVIKTADWIIDLGPEAGNRGGQVVAAGTPEDIVTRYLDCSHTARYLAPVLQASPRQDFVIVEEEQPASQTIVLPETTSVPMPWEVDGKKWHTQDRLSWQGRPCKWEGSALAWVIARVEELAGDRLSQTDWNHRTQVEIAAKVKSRGWFLHASTCDEALLWLTFRVKRNTFNEQALRSALGIRPLNETPGVHVYGDQQRVKVKNARALWQCIEVGVHRLSEVQTPAFDRFLRQALASFLEVVNRQVQRPADLMPWKLLGERWHMCARGFPPGRTPKWDLGLLSLLLDLFKEVGPDMQFDCHYRDRIVIRPSDRARRGCLWARCKTKDPEALIVSLYGNKGRFNLARLAGLGYRRELVTERPEYDIVRLWFKRAEDMPGEGLREFLREHLAAAQELWRTGVSA